MMRRLITLILLSVGLLAACAPPPVDAVAAQISTERGTFWMMVTGAGSALSAIVGVWALVWTFILQRRVAEDLEKATLHLASAKISFSGEMELAVVVRNTGRTAAQDVTLRGTLWFVPRLLAERGETDKWVFARFGRAVTVYAESSIDKRVRKPKAFRERRPRDYPGAIEQLFYSVSLAYVEPEARLTVKSPAGGVRETFDVDQYLNRTEREANGTFVLELELHYHDVFGKLRGKTIYRDLPTIGAGEFAVRFDRTV